MALLDLPSSASHGDLFSMTLIILSVYLFSVATYRLFLSPLRSVPGPWYAAISSFWMTTHTLCLRRCRAIEELVQKYGPIVHVDPNTVIFVDIPTFRSVYGVSSKLAKAPFYKSLLTYVTKYELVFLLKSNFTCFLEPRMTMRMLKLLLLDQILLLTELFLRMTTLDHGSHSMKKKGYAPHYIPTNLALFQPEIHKIMLKLVDVRL